MKPMLPKSRWASPSTLIRLDMLRSSELTELTLHEPQHLVATCLRLPARCDRRLWIGKKRGPPRLTLSFAARRVFQPRKKSIRLARGERAVSAPAAPEITFCSMRGVKSPIWNAVNACAWLPKFNQVKAPETNIISAVIIQYGALFRYSGNRGFVFRPYQ